MAGVYQSTDADECIPLLQDIGYTDVTPQPEEPDWYYCLGKVHMREMVKLKNYHLHLVKFMSDHWEKHLLFRDFLRTHPEVTQQYYEIKKRLAARHGSDREAYTESKTSFIESVVVQALQQSASFQT